MEQQTSIREPESPFPPLPVGVLCPDCGYDLRGSTSERCSECGFVLEDLRRQESLIPWSHRRQLGLFRAYWKTVGLVLRSPKRFCREMARPVSYADARIFRWLTWAHAYVPLLLGPLVAHFVGRSPIGWEAGTLPWVLGGFWMWSALVLAALPGLASYFFQRRRLSVEQQNRSIVLSYYAWAPLALAPTTLAYFVAGPFISATSAFPDPHVVLLLVGAAVFLAVVVLAYFRVLPLAATVLTLPFFALACAAVSFPPIDLPLLLMLVGVVLYAALVVLSFALLAGFARNLFRLGALTALWRTVLLLGTTLIVALLLALVPFAVFYGAVIWCSLT